MAAPPSHADVRCADGLARGLDLVRAAEDATRAALTAMHGVAPDLAVVFVNAGEPDAVEAALVAAGRLSGATTTLGSTAVDGVIAGGRADQEPGAVAVWLAALPGARLRAFHLEVIRTTDSLAVVGMPPAHDDDRVGLLLADAWSFPVEGFVEHSAQAYPGLALSGGLAAGRSGAGSTRLLLDGRVVDRGAVGVLVGGDVAVNTVVSQGCRPVGESMTVTASDGNLVQRLAGRTAVEQIERLVQELDGYDQALATRGLQLGIARDEYSEDQEQGDFLVRGIVGVDRASGAIAVGDVVEVGRTVSFHLRDAAAADADLVTLLGALRRRGVGRVDGALLFSCNSRGTSLFSSADHDPAVVRNAFDGAPVGGFFASGEIGPVSGRNYLHGFTASLVTFGPAASAGGRDRVEREA
ncbi:MAG: FIST N-terminal domain-containing protein [Actinomycetes bacterium]